MNMAEMVDCEIAIKISHKFYFINTLIVKPFKYDILDKISMVMVLDAWQLNIDTCKHFISRFLLYEKYFHNLINKRNKFYHLLLCSCGI